MGPKKNRKKDFETIARIIDFNEYYPRKIKSKFDKNFWFYAVEVTTSDKKENPREVNGLDPNVMKKLYEAGFVVQEIHHSIFENTGIISSFGYVSDSIKYKNLIFGLTLVLVRIDEIDKYFMRGGFY